MGGLGRQIPDPFLHSIKANLRSVDQGGFSMVQSSGVDRLKIGSPISESIATSEEPTPGSIMQARPRRGSRSSDRTAPKAHEIRSSTASAGSPSRVSWPKRNPVTVSEVIGCRHHYHTDANDLLAPSHPRMLECFFSAPKRSRRELPRLSTPLTETNSCVASRDLSGVGGRWAIGFGPPSMAATRVLRVPPSPRLAL